MRRANVFLTFPCPRLKLQPLNALEAYKNSVEFILRAPSRNSTTVSPRNHTNRPIIPLYIVQDLIKTHTPENLYYIRIYNLVPRACDPREGTRSSGIIRCRKPGILAKIELRIPFQRPIRFLPETDYPRASRSFPRIAGSGNEIDVYTVHELAVTSRQLASVVQLVR